MIAKRNLPHIALVGFMCSGKSTVGRALALRMGLPFHDLDRLVEAEVGPLKPFFDREGEEAFRQREKEALRKVLAGAPAIIGTGGGTLLDATNREALRAAAITVWLDVPLPDLMPRIQRAGGDRPLLFGLKGEALRQRVEHLLAQRKPLYAQADHMVPAGGAVAEVVELIVRSLGGVQES